MNVNSSRFRLAITIAILTGLTASMACQKNKGGGNTSATTPTQPAITQPVFISGKVLVEGGAVPPGPVAIERICNGTARKESYTDNSGAFQFQLDQNLVFQEASETTANPDMFPSSSQPSSQGRDTLKQRYDGCEIRAVLPGFISTSAVLRLQSSTFQYNLGTIFLKHTENAPGTTISVTTMNAPESARRAYEKGRKAFDENRFSDAEKELNTAVKLYPGLAAAWSLLGDIHQMRKEFEPAMKEYTQALAADPKFVNPSFGLALIAMQEKRWQDAVKFTDQVTKLNSFAFPSAYFYNAVANFNLGMIEPAEQSARKFKSLDTEHRHPDICLLLGKIFVQKNDYASAAQEMRDYLALVPDAEEIRQWLKHYDEIRAANQPQ